MSNKGDFRTAPATPPPGLLMTMLIFFYFFFTVNTNRVDKTNHNLLVDVNKGFEIRFTTEFCWFSRHLIFKFLASQQRSSDNINYRFSLGVM